jgi:UDP-N-acetylglucosamine 2-epimerase (non-hydrolysing)
VGTDVEKIVSQTCLLLDNEAERQRMSRVHNPYGDGEASRRIADAIAGFRQGLADRADDAAYSPNFPA